jgi:hypothetical protein
MRRLSALVVLTSQIFFASGANAPAAATPPHTVRETVHAVEAQFVAPKARDAVVLVVVDGMRWQELFQGSGPTSRDVSKPEEAQKVFPQLYKRLETRGSVVGAPQHGAPIVASGPNFVSLPGYAEIFAGRPHTCADNRCTPALGPTVVDQVRDRVSVPEEVAVFASWSTVAKVAAQDPSRVVLSTGRSRVENVDVLRADPEAADILTKGEHARAWPGEGDYRPDEYTARLALRYLETRRPRFLFVSLGDADEYAHRNEYRRYLGALRSVDSFLGDLFATLDGMGERGRRTTVLITADHGRAESFRAHGGEFPESARVWLVACGGGITTSGAVSAASTRHLADVAPTIRVLLGLPADTRDDAGRPIDELFASAD